jgi:hypothetical protein
MKVLPWAGGEDARGLPHFKAGLQGLSFAAVLKTPERVLAKLHRLLMVFM